MMLISSCAPADHLEDHSASVPDGISSAQQEILARIALEGGDVTYEEYAGVVWDQVECLTSAGLRVDPPVEADFMGQAMLSLFVYADQGIVDSKGEGVVEELVDYCEAYYAEAVKERYFTNPSAVEARQFKVEQDYADYGPEIVACPERHGVATASFADEPAQWFIMMDELRDSNGGTGPDCRKESGWSEVAGVGIPPG